MTQQSKAYYAVRAVGQIRRGGREQEQVTDHIPKNDETFLMETAGKCDRGLDRQDGGSLNQWDVLYCLSVGDPELVLTWIEQTLV